MKAYTHEECSVYTHAKIRQKHIFTYKHHLDACPPPNAHTHTTPYPVKKHLFSWSVCLVLVLSLLRSPGWGQRSE